MNERVEQFARECGAWNQVYGNRNFMIDEHFDLKKFARLIVQECAGIFEGVYTDQQRPERIDTRIKKHFGVK